MNTEKLVQLAKAYGKHCDLKLSSVSTYAANDGKYFAGLEKGAGCTLKTADRLLAWFSENWPEDLEWPADIPRPARASSSPDNAQRRAS